VSRNLNFHEEELVKRAEAADKDRLRALIRETVRDALMVEPGVLNAAHDATDALPGRDLAYGEGDGRMLRLQLHKIAHYAQSLHDELRDSDELPEWVKAKVSVMDSDMGRIKHYLSYKLMRGRTDGDF
jgi:hypothetical protein